MISSKEPWRHSRRCLTRLCTKLSNLHCLAFAFRACLEAAPLKTIKEKVFNQSIFMSLMTLNMLFVIYYLLRHHTLVLTDSKKVYSFGCGEQGQLGRGKESHPSVPLPVQLPQGKCISVIREWNNVNAMNDFAREITLLFYYCSRHRWWSYN